MVHFSSVNWTCGKFSTVESIALQHHLTHEQAAQCQAANDHGSDEALVLINCNVPEPNIWKQGINVSIKHAFVFINCNVPETYVLKQCIKTSVIMLLFWSSEMYQSQTPQTEYKLRC